MFRNRRLQVRDALLDFLRERRFFVFSIVERDDGPFALSRNLLVFLADYIILHREPIVLYFGNASSNRHGVGIGQRYFEPALNRGKNGTNASLVHEFHQPQPLKVGDARAFKVTKVDDVVNTTTLLCAQKGLSRTAFSRSK